jgi:hypothetical protein
MIINLSIEEFYSTNDGSKFNEPKTQKKNPNSGMVVWAHVEHTPNMLNLTPLALLGMLPSWC